MSRIYYTHAESPIGRLVLVGTDDGLRAIEFPEARGGRPPDPAWVPDRGRFADALEQLAAYFRGALRRFDIMLRPEGTPFQQRVWRALLDIPYGDTVSYAEVATLIGQPAAVRAVGAANGRNPIPIVIPCHRVIGSDGRLTGYGGGLAVKEALLALERGTSLPRQGVLFGGAASARPTRGRPRG